MNEQMKLDTFLRDLMRYTGRPDGESAYARTLQALGRYQAFVSLYMPWFTRAEWCAIIDANNGVGAFTDLSQNAERSQQMLTEMRGIPLGVAQSDGLGEKWGVDKDALVSKLSVMTDSELLALFDAIGVFWANPDMAADDAMRLAQCNIKR